MNFGTSGTGGRIEKAGRIGREFLNMNFELGTSCKLALAGDKLTKEFNIDKYNPKNKKDCTE